MIENNLCKSGNIQIPHENHPRNNLGVQGAEQSIQIFEICAEIFKKENFKTEKVTINFCKLQHVVWDTNTFIEL